MNTLRHTSLFTIQEEVDGRILTDCGEEFDTTIYSRFKYGDQSAAVYYGELLAETIRACPAFKAALRKRQRVVVTASAYKQLPTAAQSVATVAIDRLRESGFPIESGRIHRDNLTEGDYGAMSADERAYWMSCNGLWVDEVSFENRHVIVVDDVSITGSHGRSIVQMFESIDLLSVTLVHVLDLDPALAAHDPKIEDRMNHRVIKSVSDLLLLIKSSDAYVPNARTVKFVLSQPIDQVEWLLSRLSLEHLRLLHEGVQADEYDRMQSYQATASCIEREFVRRAHQKSLIAV